LKRTGTAPSASPSRFVSSRLLPLPSPPPDKSNPESTAPPRSAGERRGETSGAELARRAPPRPVCLSRANLFPEPPPEAETGGLVIHAPDAGMQSQIVCHACRTVLLYPRGAPSVCCAVCQAVTTVPPPGLEMA
ncbi:unnamed protein product, partial [Urochloa humidicola]